MTNQLDPRYRPYWNAVRRHVCTVCLDQANDGSCGLSGGRLCAIERHLPRLVEVLSKVKSDRMDEYVAAVEQEICATCQEQDEHGRCGLRDGGECALYTYLPLLLDAMEEVAEGDAQ
jgi:hypothetical protein